ncbi:MAG: hypothetical protein V4627_09950 [Pseudomonadota bacterium]
MNDYKHIVAIAAGTLILAACGGGGSGGAPEITSTPLAPLPTTPTPPATPRTTDFGSLQQCVAARWILIADQVRNTLLSSPLGALPGFGVTVTGQGVAEISSNGTYRYSPNFTLVMSMQGESGTGQWSGVLTGTWTVVGDVLTMTPGASSISATYSIFGQTQPLPLAVPFGGTARITECTQQTLKYQVQTPTGEVAQTLILG